MEKQDKHKGSSSPSSPLDGGGCRFCAGLALASAEDFEGFGGCENGDERHHDHDDEAGKGKGSRHRRGEKEGKISSSCVAATILSLRRCLAAAEAEAAWAASEQEALRSKVEHNDSLVDALATELQTLKESLAAASKALDDQRLRVALYKAELDRVLTREHSAVAASQEAAAVAQRACLAAKQARQEAQVSRSAAAVAAEELKVAKRAAVEAEARAAASAKLAEEKENEARLLAASLADAAEAATRARVAALRVFRLKEKQEKEKDGDDDDGGEEREEGEQKKGRVANPLHTGVGAVTSEKALSFSTSSSPGAAGAAGAAKPVFVAASDGANAVDELEVDDDDEEEEQGKEKTAAAGAAADDDGNLESLAVAAA